MKIPWNLKILSSLKRRSRAVSLYHSSFSYAMCKWVDNGSGESRTCSAQVLTMMLILYCCGDMRGALFSLFLLEWYWRREENRSHVFRSTEPDLIIHMCWILQNTKHTNFLVDQYYCPPSPAARVQQWQKESVPPWAVLPYPHSTTAYHVLGIWGMHHSVFLLVSESDCLLPTSHYMLSKKVLSLICSTLTCRFH